MRGTFSERHGGHGWVFFRGWIGRVDPAGNPDLLVGMVPKKCVKRDGKMTSKMTRSVFKYKTRPIISGWMVGLLDVIHRSPS